MDTGQYVSLGWHTTVPSALTGQDLNYFTPVRLSQLIPHLRHPSASADAAQGDWPCEAMLAALIHGAQLRDRQQVAPGELSGISERFASLLLKDRGKPSAALLRSAAAVAGVKWRPFRDQIVYAGPVAKRGTPLYALEDAVPEGVDDIEAVLARPAEDVDAFELAVAAAYVLLSLHPFVDGNGRLARALALLMGAKWGSPLAGAAVSALMRWRPDWFVGHCMRSRDLGWTHYRDGMRLAADACGPRLSDTAVTGFGAALAAIVERSSQRHAMMDQLVRMIVRGEGRESAMREALRMSSKVSAATFDAIAAAHPAVGRTDGGVDFSGLHGVVAIAISNIDTGESTE